MKRLMTILLSFSVSILLQGEVIKLAYPNWVDGVAITHLAAAVLEDEMGYEVQLTQAEPSEIFAAVAAGEQDLFLNAWLPYTQSDYWEDYSMQLERLGTLLERTRVGLAVPEYMPIESIAELATVSDALGGVVTGIEADAGITHTTNHVLKEYGLSLQQVNSSTPDMLAALERAIAAKQPIVVTAWTPHWMFAAYDIKMLNDSSNLYIEDGIRKFARLGFSEAYPEAAVFLKRYALNDAQMNELLLAIHKGNSPKQVVREWMAANPKVIKAWTAPEKKKGFFKSLFD